MGMSPGNQATSQIGVDIPFPVCQLLPFSRSPFAS
ncbi:hypothetical protein F383_33159 [Gossypium arboreum]|uniref:Uncharacterized protein n=1 Tax=Gossypium arboreum TaxID=29729 RepID=A0A0B0N0M8_GOSAR|nr:hypothetical protein F383_33159 [Gossypium arboreum]